MKFYIQACKPNVNDSFDMEDENLWDAIETIFSMNGESAFIVWDNIFIPISYKYDLGIMMADILSLLDSMQCKSSGEFNVQWPSDTFDAIWDIHWDDKSIKLSSSWNSLIGGLEEHLINRSSDIVMPKSEFINEWKMILEIVKTNLIKNGYGSSQLKNFSLLERVYDKIENYGNLYIK